MLAVLLFILLNASGIKTKKFLNLSLLQKNIFFFISNPINFANGVRKTIVIWV